MSPPARGNATGTRWLACEAWHGVVHSLRVIVALSCCIFLLEDRHLFEPLTTFVLNLVYADYVTPPPPVGMSAERQSIRRLRFTPAALAPASEGKGGGLEVADGLAPATQKRLKNERPTSRVWLAEALQSMASFPAAQPMPSVVAIDVDVTPLERLRPDQPMPGTTDMASALRELGKQHAVIALVLRRDLLADRVHRNEFIRDVCTLPSQLAQRLQANPGKPTGVFFAAAEVYSRPGHVVIDYPSGRSALPVDASAGTDALPRAAGRYPSLGVVTGAAMGLAGKCPAKPEPLTAATSTCRPKQKADAIATMTQLCAQAFRVRDPAREEEASELLVDTVEADLASIEARYRFELLNTPHAVNLVDIVSVEGRQRLGKAAAGAGTVLISIDDGTGNDVHLTLMPDKRGAQPVAGDLLHAVTALSEVTPLQKGHAWPLLLDLVVGALFAALAAPLLKLVQRLRGWPWCRHVLRLALPLLLAFAFIWLSRRAAALLLHENLWLDVVPITLGMLLHSYIEAGNRDEATTHAADQPNHALPPLRWWLFPRLYRLLEPPRAVRRGRRERADLLLAGLVGELGLAVLVGYVVFHAFSTHIAIALGIAVLAVWVPIPVFSRRNREHP